MKYIYTLIFLCYTVYAYAGTYLKPVSFAPNLGQVTSRTGEVQYQVLATASLKGVNWYLTNTGITYVFLAHTEIENTHPVFDYQKKYEVQYSRVDVELKGASIQPASIVYNEAYDWKTKHLNANNPIEELTHYKSVTVKNVYPNIDWVWKSTPEGLLEYEFVVHPGGDYTNIAMQYQHAQLSNEGNYMNMETAVGTVREGELKVYSGTQAVDASFTINEKEKTVRFTVGSYDVQEILCIDPPLALLWSNQYGGNFADGFRGVAAHSSGAYICGYSMSLNFPTAFAGPGTYFNGTFSGVSDAVLMKTIGADTIAWSVYMGGAGDDYANSIATDSTGNIYVTGAAETGFPIVNRPGAYNQANASGKNAFIAMFNPSLGLIWSTYFGNNSSGAITEALKIYATQAGTVGIVGYTNSNNFVSTAINAQANPGGGDDGFLTVLSPAGQLTYSTRGGGNGNDYFTSLFIDAVYNVCGFSNSNFTFSYCNNNLIKGIIFIAKDTTSNFKPTCYNSGNYFYDITPVDNGFAVCGKNNTNFFPYSVVQGAYAAGNSGLEDGIIYRFIKNGSLYGMAWATCVGGSGNDVFTGITSGPGGWIYLTGFTNSTNFPVQPATFPGAYFQPSLGGNYDGIMAAFKINGTSQWRTYRGGSCFEYPADIDYRVSNNKLYVVGEGLLSCNVTVPNITDTIINPNGSYALGTDGIFWGFDGAGANGGGSSCPPNNNPITTISLDCQFPNFDVLVEDLFPPQGQFPFIMSWIHNGYLDAGDYVEINTGFYDPTIYLEDANGCVFTHSYDVYWEDLTVTVYVDYIVQPSTCTSANGVLEFSNYTTLQGPNGTQTGNTFTNLPPGVYIYESSFDPCDLSTTYDTIYLTPDVSIPISITHTLPTQCVNNAGVLSVNLPSTVLPPFTYLWSTGATSSTITVPIQGGTFNVTVTGSNTCLGTGTITVAPGPALNPIIVSSIQPTYCVNDSSGQISVTVNGAYAPYTYVWNNGASTTSIQSLPVGVYAVTVTSANNCSSSAQFYLPHVGAPFLEATGTNVSCPTQLNGTATVNVQTSFGNSYDYLWSDGQSTSTATLLNSGTYSVTVTSDLGDSYSICYILNENFNNSVITSSMGSYNCTGIPVYANLSDQNTPHSYMWSTGITDTINTVLSSGIVSVTITDNTGCPYTDSLYVTVPAPMQVSYNLTPPVCYGLSGEIVISAIDGGGNFNGVGTFVVAAGVHTFTVTDAYGCTEQLQLTVPEPDELSAAYIATPILCNGETSEVVVTATGGSPPYLGVATYQLSAGSHLIAVTDTNGCSANVSFNIQEPTQLEATVSGFSFSCTAYTSSLTISAFGGTPPYSGVGTYNVSTSGNYTYTVTDANSCVVNASQFVLLGQPPTQITLSSDTICRFGTVHISASGNYDFTWQPFGFQTDSFTYSNVLQSTPIIVTGVDASGCITSDTAFLFVRNCDVSSVSNNTQPFGIKLLPNPANTSLMVMVEDPNYITYWKVFSIEGKLMAADAVDFASMVSIDVQMFAEGIYLVQLQTDAGTVVSRFMVQH